MGTMLDIPPYVRHNALVRWFYGSLDRSAEHLRTGDEMVRTVVTKGGRRLTEADIERLATSLERDLDLKSWTPRPGRPSLGDSPGVHSPRIAVRLPEELHRRAVARAASEGRSISAVVRELLERYADERGRA
jgi:plasmid stability protein